MRYVAIAFVWLTVGGVATALLAWSDVDPLFPLVVLVAGAAWATREIASPETVNADAEKDANG